MNLADSLNAEQNFDLLILQNQNDRLYLKYQVIPFLKERKDLARVWVRLYDGKPGHSIMPRTDLVKVLKDVAIQLESTDGKYQDAGFPPAKRMPLS
ncbi:hypothetical protein [Brevibacterium ravenspurgense]|uniref:hypothetical protein n=1 Tax=Brevibacterium ravenspurgense TaxID=479117 RepID=UPI0011AE94C2|nr:hypothetical protein [Brevibacterium ravenspurgense]